jgi:hypothetical protein
MIIADNNLEDGRQKPILMMVVGQHEIARFFHEISRLVGFRIKACLDSMGNS